MKFIRFTDKQLLLALTVLVGLSVAYLVHAAFTGGRRNAEIATVALERSQQLMRVRIDALFMELAEDLRAESMALQEWDRSSGDALIERWRPLLASHWAIMSIAVADAAGNEYAMLRHSDRILFRQMVEGMPPAPEAWRVIHPEPVDSASLPALPPTEDPRTRIWFSNALEDPGEEPVWHLTSDPVKDLRLQLSYLLRDEKGDEPYLVTMIEVDLSRSSWLDARTSAKSLYGYFMLDSEGRMLNIPSGEKGPDILRAEKDAAMIWARDKTRETFELMHDGRQFSVLISPYHIRGESLYTGTLMDMELVRVWTSGHRRTLTVMTALTLLLGLLAVLLWLRHQRDEANLRRQARHSRTQEKRLAKALGEREVLNREVHHRVKNNLQVVSSLLSLQAARLEENNVRDEFLRGKRRIDAMALVHHKLYGLKDLRSVDLELFIRDLMQALSEMHRPTSNTVSYEVRTAGIRGDQDTVINLGMILCELISNAFQHAFPYATGGHVEILVQVVEGDLHRLIVKDNGQGLAVGHSDGPGKLGLEIVEALAEQLDGSFHMRANGGTTFEVLFRMRHDPLATEG